MAVALLDRLARAFHGKRPPITYSLARTALLI